MAGKTDKHDTLFEGVEDFKRAPPLDETVNSTKGLKATVLGLLLGLCNLSSHFSHYGVADARFFLFLTLVHFPFRKMTIQVPINNGCYIRCAGSSPGLRYSHYCILTSCKLAKGKQWAVWDQE